MNRSWYDIGAKADEADIYIYDEIGIFGISAQAFAEELRAIEAKRIHLFINSSGGNLFDALAIYNALQRHPATVTVEVDALAASAA